MYYQPIEAGTLSAAEMKRAALERRARLTRSRGIRDEDNAARIDPWPKMTGKASRMLNGYSLSLGNSNARKAAFIVMTVFGVTMDELKSPVRTASYAAARHVMRYCLVRLTGMSMSQAAQRTWCTDHSTVRSSIEMAERVMADPSRPFHTQMRRVVKEFSCKGYDYAELQPAMGKLETVCLVIPGPAVVVPG